MSVHRKSFDDFETYLHGTRRLSESQQSGTVIDSLGDRKDSLCLTLAEKEADEFVRQLHQQRKPSDLSLQKGFNSNTIQPSEGMESLSYSSKSEKDDQSVDKIVAAENNQQELPSENITMDELQRSDEPDNTKRRYRYSTYSLNQINENEAGINSLGNHQFNNDGIISKSNKREIRRQLSSQSSYDGNEKKYLNRLQNQYTQAIEDFKILRSNLSENMTRNLNRTEQLSYKHKNLEQYRSFDNILSHNQQLGLRTQSDVNYTNKNVQRYLSQDGLNKRNSGINFDSLEQNTSSTLPRMSNNNNNNNYDNFRPSINNGAAPLMLRHHTDFPLTNEMQREHQSHLRDQAARSNFERYLRGSVTLPNQNSSVVDNYNTFHNGHVNNNHIHHFDESDIGYGGSGSTSPRDMEIMMPSDQLSSRSGSVNSRHSRSSSAFASVDSGVRMSFVGQHNSLVVVAIDFGTTFSGYAFSFTRDSTSIHMMRRWEGGDPGVTNQKTPTTLLLKPDGSFHSFGFGARDFYHDLDASEAKKWLYFDKFKMSLHSSEDLHAGIEIKAANGKMFPALKVFSHALRFFKQHVLAELSDQSTAKLSEEDITWVLTVPAIWRQPAKQFMRTAAYEAGIASLAHPDRLLIALEPEAASIFCRKLRIRDCVIEDDLKAKAGDDTLISEDFAGITQYIVVDCGGGTVDLTVHELDVTQGTLKELHKGTGGPSGATGVDREFEKLLKRIFDGDFIEKFKLKRPAAWVDLMISFEAKKRTARPDNQSPLNLSLPFSFIEYHKKHRKCSVETAIKKFKNPDIKWSSQGMLRFSANIMQTLFEPVVEAIIGHIQNLLIKASLKHVEHLFLVGGFAESPLLQYNIREALEGRVRVIIPNDVGLAILKGAVLFGLDPTVVRVRRSAYTYGVGVLNKFDPEKHQQTKRVVKDGIVWCKDIFDRFVRVDESVGLGDRVTRSYAPARSKQKSTVINIYCTEKLDVLYTTDKGVTRCGKLRIEMPDVNPEDIPIEKRGKPRELQASMIFGDTEIKVSAIDVLSGRAARANIDFLNY